MKRPPPVPTLLLSATAAFGLAACQSTRQSPIDEVSTQEGLVRADVKGVDAVYKRPGANLAPYNKLLVRPVYVEFSKNWKPEQDSDLYRMNEPDRDKIRQGLAEMFAEVMVKELQTKGGYQLVNESAADVLEVRPAIVNLYITAPDVSMQTAGRVRTYTADAGEMTLVVELRDSVTGTLLGRAFDRRSGDNMSWQWTTSVTNSAEARRIITGWADTLRNALDASRGKTT
ncbi:DUF3313 family protein [Peristeroidobacter soli]|jgi:hypothetical protein|uniref:DUF3313 family protein n=1 Tax=Peristeroidobacter soli TaxID=2497877 RepID=UPI00130088EE|nr:DUF3313 family protein [Peristeroidobacter soli]